MSPLLKAAWNDVVTPLFRRPPMVQVAALCWRERKGGIEVDGDSREILLITSRETKRWILPKGWPIDGKNLAQAAAQEAWEEGGVRPAKVATRPAGQFRYFKTLGSGAQAQVDTMVFLIEVDEVHRDFPEALERSSKWVSPARAAQMVGEADLKDILRDF
ncbi:NUDIX domain protein [Aquimixticola soesokkakensis]|uniref:NUDIX domain protein n=1 Tax=Aquimixticola soesokkakensis TaxID=1519096 RepID=A0A1Y5TM69_9RHOB|nr:NUDIX domain-containing protein [Aquimixticola soesokkakensis]SLN67183.1 NUDIX domain protein [Aquimixticola soesokkakensis]